MRQSEIISRDVKIFFTTHYVLVSFRFAVLPSSTYLFTVGVEGFYFSLDHTETHATVGRTPLDEGSARSRGLYLATQTLYKRRTYMPPAALEPTIPASARPQTYALDRAATGIGYVLVVKSNKSEKLRETGAASECQVFKEQRSLDCFLLNVALKCLKTKRKMFY
jgi:hypothetical protein